MPTYVYEEILPDGTGGPRFEVVQRMSEATLTHRPGTSVPVRRVITAPNLVLSHTPGRLKNMLSSENIEAKGFTRYEKAGHGQYVKTAGKEGPATLNAYDG